MKVFLFVTVLCLLLLGFIGQALADSAPAQVRWNKGRIVKKKVNKNIWRVKQRASQSARVIDSRRPRSDFEAEADFSPFTPSPPMDDLTFERAQME